MSATSSTESLSIVSNYNCVGQEILNQKNIVDEREYKEVLLNKKMLQLIKISNSAKNNILEYLLLENIKYSICNMSGNIVEFQDNCSIIEQSEGQQAPTKNLAKAKGYFDQSTGRLSYKENSIANNIEHRVEFTYICKFQENK